MAYNFFYDEAEHSKKITLETVNCKEYYDNFIATIVGWTHSQHTDIEKKYIEFENRHPKRKNKDGELKSQTFKNKHLKYGFASVTDKIIYFYEDFLSLFDARIIVYISAFSKIEYLLKQLFYDSNVSSNIIYSLVKTINVYRPEEVIRAIYREDMILFTDKFRHFFNDQISRDINNLKLKSREIPAYFFLKNFLTYTELHCMDTTDWSYSSSFVGFEQMLRNLNISDYNLYIDKEGSKSNTLKSALSLGLRNIEERDSKQCIGIRIADMLAGLVSKLMKSLHLSLRGDIANTIPKKKILEEKWFILNDRQLNLYKKLYSLICGGNNKLYSCYAGVYRDDFVSFVTLLSFMNEFESAEAIKKLDYGTWSEYFNGAVCMSLAQQYGE